MLLAFDVCLNSTITLKYLTPGKERKKERTEKGTVLHYCWALYIISVGVATEIRDTRESQCASWLGRADLGREQ